MGLVADGLAGALAMRCFGFDSRLCPLVLVVVSFFPPHGQGEQVRLRRPNNRE